MPILLVAPKTTQKIKQSFSELRKITTFLKLINTYCKVSSINSFEHICSSLNRMFAGFIITKTRKDKCYIKTTLIERNNTCSTLFKNKECNEFL